MRVLYFVERFFPYLGGVETISLDLLPRLVARGHEIVVVTDRIDPELPAEDTVADLPVRRLPFAHAIQSRDLDVLAAVRTDLRAIVADYRRQLIHAVFTGPSVWFLPTRPPVPLVLSLHGSWPAIDFGSPAGLTRRALDRAAWVTACSTSARDDLLRSAPDVAERASVILNGLDPRRDGPPPAPPAGPPRLLCAGRLTVEKGMDVAVEAFASIAATHPDARLVIAGDGPERPELRDRAVRHGVGDRVDFTGWIAPDAMPDLMATSTVVIVPSRLEGFGLVALEAALSERPVVATDVGGLPEAVGETGVLVPAEDPAALASAVTSLLDDPERRSTLAAAARARALSRFGAAHHADQWDALYRRLLD